jgi:hypothetical protein
MRPTLIIAEVTFRLISRSTTMGWWDWEHGELWLGSDGLLRRRRGWPNTIASVGLMHDLHARATDPGIQHAFTAEAIERTVQQGGLWIPDGTIRGARLRAGIITGRLNLTLADGRSLKLLWAKSSLTYDSVHEELGRSLGDALQLD